MCLTLCSCLRKKEFTVDAILEYMEEKYDEEFTHVGIKFGGNNIL